MLFNKNDGKSNDRIIYQTKPNMLLGCKRAIYGVVLLIVILFVSPMIIKFIGEMQVYLISYIKLPFTSYFSIAFFVIILIDIIYIIWHLIGWYSIEYYFSDSKIIVKSGVLSTKKNYMPYSAIQDINTSQSIFARLFNVGSVSVFSAYDNNQMELKYIFNPSEVEEIIFSKINEFRTFQSQPQRVPYDYENNLYADEYYDDFEPITPLNHERSNQRRNYEYYPEDSYFEDMSQHKYEYEPYGNDYMNSPNKTQHENYYNQLRDEYSYVDDDYYHDNDTEIYYNDGVDQFIQNEQDDIDSSSQDVIKRHFDKFKK